MNRRAIVILIVMVLLLLGLGGFYLFLAGGQKQAEEAKAPDVEGVVPVRSIYQAGDTNLLKPVGIGSAPNGDFWVTLRDSQKVIHFDRTGDAQTVFGERGLETGKMIAPTGVDGDPATGRVYVADRSRLRLIAYDFDGKYLWERPILNPISVTVTEEGVALTTFGPMALVSGQGEFVREAGSRGPERGQFDYPRAAAVLDDGSFVVADTNNTRVQRVKLKGEPTATATWVSGTPPRFQDDSKTLYGLPTGVAVDDDGNAFVLDGFRHEIVVLDTETGKQKHVFEELEGDTDGHFYLPTGIAYLGDHEFAITDTYNDRVQIVRLLLPAQDNVVNRNPWLLWLLALLPLLALLALLRKRMYATAEFLAKAREDGNLRMVAAAYKKVRVLPEVYAEYEEVEEEGVAIAEYLISTGEAGETPAFERFMAVLKPAGYERFLPRRNRVLVLDDDQSAAFAEKKIKTLTMEDFTATYVLEGAE